MPERSEVALNSRRREDAVIEGPARRRRPESFTRMRRFLPLQQVVDDVGAPRSRSDSRRRRRR